MGRHAHQGGAESRAQDRLLVQQRVEHPAAAEVLPQTAGDAVHAALPAHVLAEDQRLRPRSQGVAQGRVDRLRERQGSRSPRAACRRTPAARGRTAGLGGPTDPFRRARVNGGGDLARRSQARRAVRQPGCAGHDLRPDLLVPLEELAGGRRAGSDQRLPPSRAAGLWRSRRGSPCEDLYASSASDPACPRNRTVRRCRTAGRRSARTPSATSRVTSEEPHGVVAVDHPVVDAGARRERPLGSSPQGIGC